jgi:predicted transcriptional regulator
MFDYRHRRPPGPRGARARSQELVFALAMPLRSVFVLPLVLIAVAGSASGSAPLSRAVQVRLDEGLVQRLKRIEDHARGLGRRDFRRSSMIRDAVAAYVAPLISLLDRSGRLNQADRERLASAPGTEKGFSEATRVRLDDDLVRQLDRIEAYARGLGYRHVTRSSLIRDGVSAYLSGFDSELSRNDSDQADPHSLVVRADSR